MTLGFHQQAADELGGNHLGGAGEEGLGEVLVGRGGYRCGCGWKCLGGGGGVIMGAFKLHYYAMSEEQLKAFMEAVKTDAGLQEKLNAAADADAIVAIAKEVGFVISAEELQRAQAEISEEELEGVAGGIFGKQGPLGGFGAQSPKCW
jgi:predicted ribosomally synthesized peptide with nif11-like leader